MWKEIKKEAYLILCLLAVTVAAASTAPTPCCAPTNMTYDLADFTSSVKAGNLELKYINYEVAYSAELLKIAFVGDETAFDGKIVHVRAIFDYQKKVEYDIKESKCTKHHLTGDFQQECIPVIAKPIDTVYVGDNQMQIAVWDWTEEAPGSQTQTAFISASVGLNGCIPFASTARLYDQNTGQQQVFSDSRFYNVKKGLSDPDKHFTPPPICSQVDFSDKPRKASGSFRRFRFFQLDLRGL